MREEGGGENELYFEKKSVGGGSDKVRRLYLSEKLAQFFGAQNFRNLNYRRRNLPGSPPIPFIFKFLIKLLLSIDGGTYIFRRLYLP